MSGATAWWEGSCRRRPGLAMGFVNHGGMWGDLILLPIANAAIVPHLTSGQWLAPAIAAATVASLWVHVHWYRGDKTTHSAEHMWPTRRHGSWHRDLSVAGWLHVLYVIGELTLLVGFLVHPMPRSAVWVVAAIFTLHVPLGLLQPRWFLTGDVASPRQQPLLLPLLAMLWAVALMKVM
ncbi:MAG TPA: hypothetical protein VNJ02_16385 [Vicinamibacterales bacterium]|nr:hypothetical protein [Vicinamibacterales bacterium]